MTLRRFFSFGCLVGGLIGAPPLHGQTSGAPFVSSIPDQGVFPNGTSRPIALVVGDDATPAGSLVVTGACSDPVLVPPDGLVFGGSASNRTLTITPAPGLTGTATVSVVVTDLDGLSATNTFGLDVNYFTPVASGLPAMLDAKATWADVDNDGLPDAVLGGYAGFDLPVERVYRNLGNNTFADSNAGLTAQDRNQTFWGDFDRDGYLDVAISGSTNTLYRNNGDGTFAVLSNVLPRFFTGAAAWGDYDNDGDLDVVTMGSGGNGSTTRLMRNNGDGTFAEVPTALAPAYGGSLDWGDYDNDGDLDLLLTGYYGTMVTKLFRNDGNGIFTDVPAGMIPIYYGTARWGDYDNDGYLDILVGGGNGDVNPASRIYHNNGNGTFTDINAGLKGVGLANAAWADFDNDGYLDVIVTGQSTNGSFTGLYHNNRDQTFAPVNAGLTNVQFGSCAWADSDRDGDLDLLLVGYGANWANQATQLYRNNAPSNAPPAAPASLATTVDNNGEVIFTWSKPLDDRTPSDGLMYGLRVGTTPGGSEIMTAQASPSGLRRLAQSTGMHANWWRLRNLPKGAYYWSVQAIDTAYAGSPFAPEKTFTITNTPPAITVAAEVRSGPSLAGSVPFTVADAESAATQLTVTAQSLDGTFIPPGGVSIQGTGAARTLSFKVGFGQIGTNYIALHATDPGGLTADVQVRVISEWFTSIPLSDSTNFSGLTALQLGPGYPYGNPVVDIDRDGDLDVLLQGSIYITNGNYYLPVFVVASNNGSGGFTFTYVTNFLSSIYNVWLDDFNRDGKVDMLADGQPYGSGTQFFAGDGHGGFLPGQNLAGTSIRIFADMDNDGDLDGLEFMSSSSGGTTGVAYYQNVGGQLRRQPGPPLMTFTTYQETGPARAVDIDGDGDVDFVIPGEGTNSNQRLAIRVMRNPGRGPLSSEYYPILGQATLYTVSAADWDDDGDLDMRFMYETSYSGPIVAGYAANDGLGHFYFGNTNNLVPSVPGYDFDNDGDLDRVVSELVSTTPTVTYVNRLYLKTGPNQYSPQPFTMTQPQFAGDFDGDGDLDYMQQTEEKDQFGRVVSPMQWRLFRNNTDHTNRPPAAPTGLATTQQTNDSVRFTWNTATDDHTPSAALTYNLRVGTTPGGVDIVAPCSDTTTGKRWLVTEGNNGRLRFRNLYSLPPGTYYWSVQAVDGVYIAGSWAPEKSFTINRPTISPPADVVTPPGVTSKPIPFTVTGGASSVNALALSAVADDPTLIPTGTIVFSGTGAQRSLTLTPAARSGDTDITLTATDQAGYSAIVRFHVRVAWWDPMPIAQVGIQRFEKWYFLDADLDGWLDFFGYTPQGNSAPLLASFHNLGDGTFESVTNNNLPYSTSSTVELGGFNNDNVADVLTLQQQANPYNSRLQVWQGTGTGFDFQPLTELSNRGWVASQKWVDIDNDGCLDMVHLGWVTTNLWGLFVAHGNRDGTFTYYTNRIGMYSSTALAVADFDLDGDLDLVVSGTDYAANGRDAGTNFNRLYLNQGNGVFTPASAGLPQTNTWKFSIADVDQDGWPDVLMLPTASSTTQAPRLMRNVGGAFVEVPCGLPPELDLITWGDFDNDGDPDLVAAYSSDYPWGDEGPYLATIFRNDGGVLTRMDTGLPWILAHFADLADTDNDGDLDLLMSGETGWNQTGRFIYRNTCTRSNTPPPAPLNPTTGHGAEFALLQWTPAADAESGTALTYNVRIGTTPGGSEVMSAAADPATGRRRLNGIGNVGFAPRWRLMPPEGTYYWSVQAIDVGYAASPFAPEVSFTYYHPTISALANQLRYPGTGAAVQPVTVADPDSDAATLALSGYSSNPALVPPANILFGGSGSNRTVSILPAAGAGGVAFITVVVTDVTGLSATNSFRFEVAYFTDLSPVLPGVNGTPAFADFSNDGLLDLYLAGSIFKNNGDLNFSTAATVTAGQRHGVIWGDYDRDGDLDLAVASSGPTKIYRNDGNGVFTDSGAVIPAAGNSAIAWGDFDNDGDLDLLNLGDGKIYRNDGPAGFVGVSVGLPALGESSAAFGDFDNDGDLDLLVSGFQGPSTFFTAIYRNDGGVFSNVATLYGLRGSSVAWGDYDGDGYLDALTAGYNDYAYQVRVYHNNHDGTFTDINLGLPGVAYGNAQWLDFDNDGRLDIFQCGSITSYPSLGYATRIYRNNGDGTFTDVQGGLPQSDLASWGDLDGDSDLDLIVSGGTLANYRLLENRCPYTNTPPLAPAGLVATLLPDNNVLLSWTAASDLETTNSAALNYSLRAGSLPGGMDLISAPARSDTGVRRLAERGALNSLSWVICDVPRGTWYWSVQAVDTSFAGSPFAPESSFTITNARPLISTVPNQLTVPGRATPLLPFTVSDFETPASNLLVSAWSSNTNLVPPAGLAVGGAGANRTITVQPAPGQSGTATVSLSVTDAGGLSATSRFDVVVQMFTDAAAGLPVSSSGASAWGDYDNDGDLDIALAGSGVSYTSIFRNSGGVFSNQNFTLPNRTDCEIAWIDYDRDGDLDLMESGWNGGYTPATYFFRNNGTNTFTSIAIAGLTNVADGTMSWADIDNDGDPDLLLSGDPNTYHTPDGFTRLYRNSGGVFTNTGVVLPQLVKSASAWADVDNDGDLDLLLAGQTGATAATAYTGLFLNDGAGNLVETPAGLPAVTQCAVAFGDYDNDGYWDILLAGLGPSSNLVARVYRNNGNGTFTDSGAALTGVYQAAVAWGDCDNDGFLDALVSGTTNGYAYGSITRVYHNDGNGTFTALTATLPGINAHNSSWGDYDNDGDLDLLLGSQVYRNNWNIPNTPPTAPANLAAQVTSDIGVRFSWSAATDLQTTNSRGLNYNLRVGTTPGGTQIVAPQSDPATGYRRVPRPGNAGTTTSWSVTGLTNGTYYWSVQAIDTSFAGSAFAAEATLVVSRPVVSAITNLSTPPNTVAGPIAFTVGDAETPAFGLVVTVTSSDTNVVPASGLVLAGTDTNRTLTITPAADRSGMVTITIFATDQDGQTGSRSFLLTVERFVDIAAGLPPMAAPVAWGDFDNDGNLDLVLRNTLYRNSGAGSFTVATNWTIPVEGYSLFGDYNADGRLDLVVPGANAERILRNLGNGAFLDAVTASGTTGAPAWGDFDNDGDLDLAVVGTSSSRIYRNLTNGFLADIGASLPAAASGAVAWGDYDKDGDLDLLVAGGGLLRVYRNNGNGTFTDIGASLPGIYVASVAWGDFNNDGNLDFVVCGSTNNGPMAAVTRIYRNTTNSTASLAFTNIYASASAQGPAGVWKGAVVWGDYDNDGDLDLLVTGEAANGAPLTRVYRNDGGVFTDSGWFLPALKNSFAAWGDYDNDGFLDLALSGYGTNGLPVARIYRNYGAPGRPNSPPAAPAGLSATVTKKSVRLAWSAATDPNQTNALTYNLRVGTAPGLGNIMSPMAGPDGIRRLPALGNTQYRLGWTLTNLAGGTYYWSVQAVDHAFAGSAFAAEQSFTISNRPPTVIDWWITCVEDSYVLMALSGSDPDNDPLTTIIATQPLFGSVSGAWPNIMYRPREDFFGFDEFTYRVSDGTTSSPSATVFVTVTPVQDLAAPSLSLAALAAGQVQLALQAEPWRTWQIQVSDDLVRWQPWTNLLATNLLTLLVDQDAPRFPQRFYRAALTQIEPRLLNPQPVANGFQFLVEGEVGRNYEVQFSANLSTWTPLAHLLITNTTVPWTDPDAGRFGARFYRVRALQ